MRKSDNNFANVIRWPYFSTGVGLYYSTRNSWQVYDILQQPAYLQHGGYNCW